MKAILETNRKKIYINFINICMKMKENPKTIKKLI